MKWVFAIFLLLINIILIAQASPVCLYQHEDHKFNFSNSNNRNDSSLISIKVVVHILWFQKEENISEEQIQSQIIALNRDFNGIPQINCKIPTFYIDRIGRTRFQFCLADKDPNGNPTNGIVRTFTAKTFNKNNITDAALKSSGGSNAWQNDQYLNIWVAPFGNDILGYSGGVALNKFSDGIFINTKVFGTIGNLLSNYNLGHTLSHEVGHYFGLNHIWGGDGCNCEDDDGIDDTPKQECYSFGCDPTPQYSCGQYSMNYNLMDYSYDDCRGYFTNGQCLYMRNVLLNYRLKLQENANCNTNLNFNNSTINCSKLTYLFENNTNFSIKIYSISGQLVYDSTSQTDFNIIDINNLSNGIYLVSKTINGQQTIEKLVIFK
jgi:hypothetical protein